MADEDYVEDWSELSKSELVEECKARGLPATGTKSEIVARLEADDMQRDAAEEEGETQRDAAESPTPDAPAETPATVDPPTPDSSESATAESEPQATEFRVEFPLGDDYDTELVSEHDLEWKLEARSAAIAAGHTVFPGAYSARLEGYAERDGETVAVYVVPLMRG